MAVEVQSFGHGAMATAFRVSLACGELSAAAALSAARAAFAEIDRLEGILSRFLPGSDIWQLSRLGAGGSLLVTLETLDCLLLALAVHGETGGAFDITVGPVARLFQDERGREVVPDGEVLEQLRERVGMGHMSLDEASRRVRVDVAGLPFDLGGVGKGYALDRAAQLLEDDWGVRSFRLDAGTSTILVGEPPPGEEGWRVLLYPEREEPVELLLVDGAVSGSGFEERGAHLIDPRSLRPVSKERGITYARAPSAALADALSTAFAVMGEDEARAVCERYEGVEVG